MLECSEFLNRKPNVRDPVGAPVVPLLYYTLFYPAPAYLLLVPIAMGAVGVLLAGLRNVWALLVGFGGLPAA